MKSFRRTSRVKAVVKARSADLTVYRSMVKTAVGSVTTAFISTVSTNGSVKALSFRGV